MNEISGSGQLLALPRVGLHGQPLDEIWPTFGVLNTLITAIDNRDRYTRRYSEQVATLALRIGQQLELPAEMMEAIQTASLLHDVGKVAVPDAILRKPGRLTPQEIEQMQQHAEFGPLIVRGVPHLERVLEGVRSHHECWNGSGYPDGLQGEKIPFIARLLAVPVCFAAMTTSRPYRSALSVEEALSQIQAGRETQFDPQIVDAFVCVIQAQQNAAPKSLLSVSTHDEAKSYSVA
jgi:HD-GYP domain-containing protein (c-di-GMP phosphodiesterase class II)